MRAVFNLLWGVFLGLVAFGMFYLKGIEGLPQLMSCIVKSVLVALVGVVLFQSTDID
jgi:hypothetical protein